jgi:hypothetical protein
MDPVSGGLTLAGGAIKALGTISAGRQQQQALVEQGRQENIAGNLQATRIREQARRAIGQQIGGQFANGFQGGTGSALDALSESQINSTLDALQTRRDAATKAASLYTQGNLARQSAGWGAASGLVGTASQLYGLHKDWTTAHQEDPRAGGTAVVGG